MSQFRNPRMLAAAALAVVAAACSGDAPTQVEMPDARAFAQTAPAEVWLCKISLMSFELNGTGTYDPASDPTYGLPFTFQITGGDVAEVTMPAADYGARVNDGQDGSQDCRLVYSGDSGGSMEIIETNTNSVMNSVFILDRFGTGALFRPGTWDRDPPNRRIWTDNVPEGQSLIFVKNTVIETPPPPPGMQGCTPGYWRQPQHFGNWTGYDRSDNFGTVFGVDYDYTLLEAVWARGGGANALARHAVAALLNYANDDVAYPYLRDGTGGIFDIVQTAFATGEYEPGKNLLADANELGCDLARAEAPDSDRVDSDDESPNPGKGKAKGKNRG